MVILSNLGNLSIKNIYTMKSPHNICPVCVGYLLDFGQYHPEYGWKKCPSCGWCEDSNGENLLTMGKSEEEKKAIIKAYAKGGK